MRCPVSIGDVPDKHSYGTRILAFCLIFASVAWDHAACTSSLNTLPALLCQRLGHHTGRASGPLPCCPLPVSSPVHRSSQRSCCEAPAPLQDALPKAKQSVARNAHCCTRMIALVPPPRVTSPLLDV